MKKLIMLFFMAMLFIAFNSSASAKCQRGSDWKVGGKKFYVCVKGQGFSARKKAKKACKKIKGRSCRSASGFKSSCSGGYCYTINGRKHKYLRGF
ncbi:MAG: hypothetical protein ACI86H_002037 [bacterium]|jgi:hypothetical protein